MRPGLKIAASLFVVIAFAHLLRLFFLAPMTSGSWNTAQWISLLGVILPLVVAGLLCLERRGRKQR